MSRIGRKPIIIPSGVTVSASGQSMTVAGPKGSLPLTVHPLIKVDVSDGKVVVTRLEESKKAASLHGLVRSLLANMVTGVTTGFVKNLELVGTGYRVAKKGQGLTMTLGFSHPVDIQPIQGITFGVEGNTKFSISGIDKQLVGQVSATIRAIRPPEPYKGKGVRYTDEHVRRKAGKQAKTAAG